MARRFSAPVRSSRMARACSLPEAVASSRLRRASSLRIDAPNTPTIAQRPSTRHSHVADSMVCARFADGTVGGPSAVPTTTRIATEMPPQVAAVCRGDMRRHAVAKTMNSIDSISTATSGSLAATTISREHEASSCGTVM
jgi:hypothetical protein